MRAPLDVQGAVPEMLPKRRTQVACGLADSAAAQRELTDSCSMPGRIPSGGSVELQESFDKKFAFEDGKQSEVWVASKSGLSAETQPPAPDPVCALVPSFLAAVKDNSVVRSMRETQERISLGN